MGLDWTQITLVSVATATAFGSALGAPIANAIRRPAIKNAIEKESEPLKQQNAEQAALLVQYGLEIKELKSQVSQLQGILMASYKPPALPSTTPVPVVVVPVETPP